MTGKYWRREGLLFEPEQKSEIIGFTHASNPLAIPRTIDVYQILYSTRDKENRSSIASIEIDIKNHRILENTNRLILTHGSDDSFYSHGISIGNYWQENGETHVGFMGWHKEEGKHWFGEIGAVNLNNLMVYKLLATSNEDPISLSYPFILKEDGIYKMWYGSTVRWETEHNEMIHVIKYATSKNARDWVYHDQAVETTLGIEQAFSRPSILKINNEYNMWYSCRGEFGTSYTIGHSVSSDGISWRRGKLDLLPSQLPNEWDSDMTCYPYVFSDNENVYMLYNGNKYGKTGFGLARLEM